MKRELVKILACPVCKGDLELKAEKENNQEVVSGSLYCPKDKISYPVIDGIPSLLPPEKKPD